MSYVVLITGVNGFVGKHLVRELHSRGCVIYGVGLHGPVQEEIKDLIEKYFLCDVTDARQVAALPLEKINAVINLAGLARVGDSFKNPELYKSVNVSVLASIGTELLKRGSKARIIAVSTGAVYEANQPLPLSEDSKTIQDGSPYAISKLMMEAAADNLRRQGLDCVVVRPFNHIGPGQDKGFLVPDLYTKIADTHISGEAIEIGNLETRRDYTDVRDIARAYADLATASSLKYGLYNVCSGRSISGREILDLLIREMDLHEKVQATVDNSLIRPDDPQELLGSPERLHRETGWQPKIPLTQTVQDFVSSER